MYKFDSNRTEFRSDLTKQPHSNIANPKRKCFQSDDKYLPIKLVADGDDWAEHCASVSACRYFSRS